MRRSSRSAIQIVLAFALSLVAGILVFRWLSGRAPVVESKQAEVTTVQVVVASQALQKGQKISPEMLKTVPFIVGSEPSQSFREPEALHGRVLSSSVGAGEAVTPLRLAPEEVRVGGVSAMVSPGKRAMAVKGNKVMGLSGFIRPGNQVDVLVTLKMNDKEDQMTKLVLERIPVLATGTELEPAADGEKPSSVDVYTLELTPEEGEKLALAATQGTLHFALRNEADVATVFTPGADTATTLSSYRTEPPAPAAKASGGKARPMVKVEVIQGGEKREVSFQ